jgi:phosphatidate phosphatase APP1
MWVKARVLKDGKIAFTQKDSLFRNLINTYKRFESDEISNAPVNISWEKGELEVHSDKEGYIQLEHQHGCDLLFEKTQWLKLILMLPEQHAKEGCEIMVPGQQSDFGVISDIDDTVLFTGVSSRMKWQLIINSIARNVYQRRTIEGADSWYKLLHTGSSGNNTNPFFYISNSPWNIHNYLRFFLQENGFPKGPILLRDIGFSTFASKKREEGNKYKQICRILEAFPQLKFILIGDAAEEDADIYVHIARRYPGKINSIYIRSVDHKKRMEWAAQFIAAVKDVEILLVHSAEEAIDDSRKKGYIQ